LAVKSQLCLHCNDSRGKGGGGFRKINFFRVGITPANCNRPTRTKFGTHAERQRSRGDNVQEILSAIGKVGQRGWGGRTTLAFSVRYCAYFQQGTTYNFPTTDFHQIWPGHVNRCPLEDFESSFRKR